jgi:hypothetical protein
MAAVDHLPLYCAVQELQRATTAVGVELRRLVLLAEQRDISITGRYNYKNP